MRRRNITLRGDTITARQRRAREMKEKLQQAFISNEEAVDKVIDHLVSSGWTVEDIVSFNKQADNKYRPAVDAFTFHSEHVLDQLFLQQGAYTDFMDTASDPNYALRHKGQTELTMRRITSGDLLMLQASQAVETRPVGQLPIDNQITYWQDVWHEFLFLTIPEPKRNKVVWLWDDLYAAATASIEFCTNSLRYGGATPHSIMHSRFFQKTSPFYVGFSASYETMRRPEGFERGYLFQDVNDENESLAMAAVVIACHGIDNYARATLDGYRVPLPLGSFHHTIYLDYVTNLKKLPHYFKEPANDQETQESGAERDSFLRIR